VTAPARVHWVFQIVDIFPLGVERAGHAPGSWDCPCGPWVLTQDGVLTVRHTPDLPPLSFGGVCERCDQPYRASQFPNDGLCRSCLEWRCPALRAGEWVMTAPGTREQLQALDAAGFREWTANVRATFSPQTAEILVAAGIGARGRQHAEGLSS
jgi:hypothetical protein